MPTTLARWFGLKVVAARKAKYMPNGIPTKVRCYDDGGKTEYSL